MKIERGSVTITDIPYFSSIEVMPSGVLLARNPDEQTCHLADIEALRDALTEAIRIKREMDGAPASPITGQVVFHASSGEPGPEVTKVRDADDDLWYRREDGYWDAPAISNIRQAWNYVLDFAPLTDATND